MYFHHCCILGHVGNERDTPPKAKKHMSRTHTHTHRHTQKHTHTQTHTDTNRNKWLWQELEVISAWLLSLIYRHEQLQCSARELQLLSHHTGPNIGPCGTTAKLWCELKGEPLCLDLGLPCGRNPTVQTVPFNLYYSGYVWRTLKRLDISRSVWSHDGYEYF